MDLKMDETLEGLAEEFEEFSNKWNDYFSRVEALAKDKEIDDALGDVEKYENRIQKRESAIKLTNVEQKSADISAEKFIPSRQRRLVTQLRPNSSVWSL